MYDFEYLGTSEYEIDRNTTNIPSIILVDNQAMVRMSKNYKVTSKNQHIARRWHFVLRGVKDKLLMLHWIPSKNQLADNCTKTQMASKSFSHFSRTLIPIPYKVEGFKSNTIGNR